VIKYLGSKRALLPVILDAARADPAATSVLDLFSGTARVGHALKRAGYRVIANDHNAYAAALARCYVQADREDVLHDASLLVDEFNLLSRGTCEPGYFTHTFCEQSRFVQPRNGARIDTIREAIAAKQLPPDLEAVMLVSLMQAADRVDSTTGLQMAYLKDWSRRSHNDLELRVPDVLPRGMHGKGESHMLDALQAAQTLTADVAYIDPPYNQHSYLGNYHMWESLVRWDKPQVFGVACKRVDVRERQSVFNSRPGCSVALRQVLQAVRARTLIISFSNEGYVPRDTMEQMLGELFDGHARVTTIENDYPRYVGAQIGIYNPQGERVGKVSHLRNTEFVYVVQGAEGPSPCATPKRPLGRGIIAPRLGSISTPPVRASS
jgi:adenine-specific DNA-methyltransferase